MIDSNEPIKRLPDGRAVYLQAMTFGKVRLCVGPEGQPFYDDGY